MLLSIVDAYLYYCTPPPNVNSYYLTICTGFGNDHAAAKILSQSTFATCTAVPTATSGYYVSSPCVQGSYNQVGSNLIKSLCSTPGAGQYVSQTCVVGSLIAAGSNTVMSQCNFVNVPSGSYNSPCIAGTFNTLGANSVVKQCSTPVPGQQYVSVGCAPGTGVDHYGNDATILNCDMSVINSGSYVASPCVTGSYNTVGANRVTQVCSVPASNQFVQAPCIMGSLTQAGSNAIIAQCSNPPSNFYVAALCIQGSINIAGNNTQFLPCGGTGPNEVITNNCFPGTYNILGSPSQFTVKAITGGNGGGLSLSTNNYIEIGAGGFVLFLIITTIIRRYQLAKRKNNSSQ